MSESNRLQTAIVEEVTPGTTPSSPTFQILRTTGEGIAPNLGYTKSNELRSDAQVSDIINITGAAGGTIPIEFSAGSHDDLIAAAIGSAGWSSAVTVTATTISAAASDNSFNDSGNGFGSLVVGQWIKVSGFANAANNGYFKILTKTNAKITVTGGTLVDAAATPSITVKMGEQIVNGTANRFFTIEKKFTDLTNDFERAVMQAINTAQLSIPADEKFTGSFDFMGKSAVSGNAALSGATYTAATTTPVFSGANNVPKVYENGSLIDATSFAFNTNRNLRNNNVIGTKGPKAIKAGQFNVTGTVQMYYESRAVMDRYINDTYTSIAVVAQDSQATPKAYIFEFPQIKFTAGKRVAGGPNQDIIGDMSWEAARHPTEGIMMRVVRF